MSDPATAGPAERIAREAKARELTIGVAESLTGGLVASSLAAAPDAAEWFRGGVVAYAAGVKRDLLDVGDHPVVSDSTAEDMARGAAAKLGADVAVALTGVGGPDPEDGLEPGTVWLAVDGPVGTTAKLAQLSGDPAHVCRDAARAALELVEEYLALLDSTWPIPQAS